MVNLVLCHTLAGRLSAQGGLAYRAFVADVAPAHALGAGSAGLLWAACVKNRMESKGLQAWGRELGEALLSWWLKGEERPTGEGRGWVRGCRESCQATDRAPAAPGSSA